MSREALEALSMESFGQLRVESVPMAAMTASEEPRSPARLTLGSGSRRRIRVMGDRISESRMATALKDLPAFCFEAGLSPDQLANFARLALRRGTFIGLCLSTATAYRVEPSAAIAASLGACGLFDEGLIWRIEVALAEALANALLHGNLEANKFLRSSADAYADYADHLDNRLHDDGFAHRAVSIFARLSAGWLTLEVLDEGHGFEKTGRGGPTPVEIDDPFGLPSGRGLLVTSAMADRIRHRNGGRRLDLGFALVA
ncbi:hypothetical protein VZ95_14450 [Elstera litoralis]|uniref:Histidine kinase/HSP90-like ATPase domain-containing protein n=1 Tax=Elstera litoralis TaxID=552518 RepID=A0A0F3IQF3_9PROT|nr:ATP-binding protein [Elstera litoralis]KJV08961.1 hypothetical protein VZ95_14450 [Elstera litoralis]